MFDMLVSGEDVRNAGDNGSMRSLCDKQQEALSTVNTQLSGCIGEFRKTVMDLLRKKKQEEGGV